VDLKNFYNRIKFKDIEEREVRRSVKSGQSSNSLKRTAPSPGKDRPASKKLVTYSKGSTKRDNPVSVDLSRQSRSGVRQADSRRFASPPSDDPQIIGSTVVADQSSKARPVPRPRARQGSGKGRETEKESAPVRDRYH